MPFTTAAKGFWYGLVSYAYTPSTYCQSNTSASDYGKCYNIIRNKAVFVQTDTTTWPIDPTTGDSFPCAADGTCTKIFLRYDMEEKEKRNI